MLHQCPAVVGSKVLTEDGLYWGGDPGQAEETLNEGTDGRVLTGFDYKFFVQSTVWAPGELDQQMKDGTWFTANVSKEVIFKSRDRLGTQRAKVSDRVASFPRDIPVAERPYHTIEIFAKEIFFPLASMD